MKLKQSEKELLINAQISLQNELVRQRQILDRAIDIYENRNTTKYKKIRFMEDKSTADLMYDVLKGK